MRRRAFVQCAALSLLPSFVPAQVQRQFRVAILWSTNEAAVKDTGPAFLGGLEDLGYVQGRNLVVDVRYARSDYGRMPALAEELIALKPDVLLGIESVAVVIRSKTTTIPIVVIAGPDPVAAGLVKSASRPGTNVTGNAFRQDQLIVKQVELLADLVPGMSHIAFLNLALSPGDPFLGGVIQRYDEFAKKAAAEKGLTLTIVAARDPASLQRAFETLERARPQGLVVASGGFNYQYRQEIADAARRLRLPTISAFPPGWLQAGGLLDYGPNYVKYYRYAASFVDRILKGGKPAEIPIEYPAVFELGVNLKTARELGVKIPRSMLLLADRVIE